MLQDQYSQLDAVTKISLIDVVNNATLYELITAEILSVKQELCTLAPGATIALEYAIIQQRLISLQDLEDFFKRVRIDTTPQPEAE